LRHIAPKQAKKRLKTSEIHGIVLDGQAVGYAMSLNARGVMQHDITIRLSTQNASIFSRVHLGGRIHLVLGGRNKHT
jgi:hypothetical protein